MRTYTDRQKFKWGGSTFEYVGNGSALIQYGPFGKKVKATHARGSVYRTRLESLAKVKHSSDVKTGSLIAGTSKALAPKPSTTRFISTGVNPTFTKGSISADQQEKITASAKRVSKAISVGINPTFSKGGILPDQQEKITPNPSVSIADKVAIKETGIIPVTNDSSGDGVSSSLLTKVLIGIGVGVIAKMFLK